MSSFPFATHVIHASYTPKMLSPVPETRASLILRLTDRMDIEAWDEFVQLYGPVVYRLARRRGLQPADADDLVQEVFSVVARSVEQWLERVDRGSFLAWLLTIARNTTINFLTRRRHQRMGAGGESAAAALAECADSKAEVSREVDLEYRRRLFAVACERIQARVSESTWRAFWMTSVEQTSIEQAAAALQISVGNVYIARSRVMARLREIVQQYEERSSC